MSRQGTDGLMSASGPFIESRDSVRRSMWEVCGALLPVTAAALLFFGPWSLYLVFASALSATLFEVLVVRGDYTWRNPLGDGSAFLAGMLFGLTLSPGTPWWIPFLGAAIVVVVGKQAFGGLGNNLFNPALVARAVLLLAYPALVMEWRVPFDYDAVTSATPLSGAPDGYLALFLGNTAGSIGETSVLALLIGAVFLYVRGFIGWRISVSYIAAAAVTALILGIDPLHAILSGSLMFAALFMSTDMVTSPVARSARVVYGIGCGVLTVLIREFTVYPEGVTFAVLLMNGLTPLIDVTVVDTFFGQVEKRRHRLTLRVAVAAVAGIGLLAGAGARRLQTFGDAFYVRGEVRHDLRAFFPEDGRYAMPEDAAHPELAVEQVYAREGPLGWLVYSAAPGFYGPIRVVTALDNDRRIIGLRVVEHKESATLGGLVRRPSFLNQFLRRGSADPSAVTTHLQAISGATVSSRAVATAVERALRFQEPPRAPRTGAMSLRDGTFRGAASGYQGRIEVEVTVHDGRIAAVEVTRHGESRRLAEPAFGRLTRRMIEQQQVEVDAISGATGSSRGLMAAVFDALEP